MIGFSASEILFSVVYAVVYGALFSLGYRLFFVLFQVVKEAPKLLLESLQVNKIFSPISLDNAVSNAKIGPAVAFISTFLFFFGFLLLSYFSLDGQIRIYMLIISSASIYVFNSAFSVVFDRILTAIFDFTFTLIFTVARLVILPAKRLFVIIKKYFIKKQ